MIQVEVQVVREFRSSNPVGREVIGYKVTKMVGAVLLPSSAQTRIVPSVRVGDTVPEGTVQMWVDDDGEEAIEVTVT